MNHMREVLIIRVASGFMGQAQAGMGYLGIRAVQQMGGGPWTIITTICVRVLNTCIAFSSEGDSRRTRKKQST